MRRRKHGGQRRHRKPSDLGPPERIDSDKLLRGWCEAGFNPREFWTATPREYSAALRGVGDRLVREHDGRAFAAFWTARWGREKDMTPLSEVMIGDQSKAEPRMAQTPDQIQRGMNAWVIATGGTLGRGKRKRRRKAPAEAPAS